MGHIPGVILGALPRHRAAELLRYIGPLQEVTLGRVVVDRATCACCSSGRSGARHAVPAQGLWPSATRARELRPDAATARQEQDSVYDASR